MCNNVQNIFLNSSSNTDINFRPKTQLFISEAVVRPCGKFRKKNILQKPVNHIVARHLITKITESSYA